MRNSKIHPNRVVFNVARVLVIVIVGLTGNQPMAAQSTPIAAQAAISNADTFSGSSSSSQPGAAPIPLMTAQDLIMDLGILNPWAINDLGQIVGQSTVSGDSHAYLWENGKMTDLKTLGGPGSWARDINEHGQVVGVSSYGTGSETRRAFLWQNDAMTGLPTLGGTYSAAFGMNNLGQVVGESYIASGERHAFLWQNDTMTDLKTLSGPYSEAEAINDKGQIVGSSVVNPQGWTHAFFWEDGKMTNLGALPRGANSYAYDINERSQVVGYSDIVFDNPSYGYHHAFLWQNGNLRDLGTLGVPNSNSHAEAINDKGQIVGESNIEEWSSERHVFLWQNDKMIDLNHLVAGTGWAPYSVTDINNAGQVVGWGMFNSDPRGHPFLLKLPPDLSVESVAPVQVLEGLDLVRYKSTAVKVVIRKNGKGTVENVPVKLVYGASTYTRFYVADKLNMDNPDHVLEADNATYPLDFTDAENDETKTIYFFSDGLAPQGDTFQASATVNYKDEILELDEDNNTTSSAKVPVYDTHWNPQYPDTSLSIYYIRTDGLSRPDLAAFYTASNNFIKGVYPVAERRFIPGKASTTLDTTAWRGDDGKLDSIELGKWVDKNLPLLRLAYPDATRFVAAVPSGWFQDITVSLTGAGGISFSTKPEFIMAEAQTPARPNGSNLVAHELGHSYGLARICEEYDEDCNGIVDRLGVQAPPGLWVNERIPIENVKDRSVYCFMGANADLEYWVDAADYAVLLYGHRIIPAFQGSEPAAEAGAILVVANFDTNGAVTLDNWYTLPEAYLSELPAGPYVFEYQDAGGNILDQRSFDISFSLEGQILPQVGLVATIPAVPGTAKIVVKYYDTPQAEKVFSANAPAVTILSPNGGEQLWEQAAIRWTGSDADGDALTYALLISPDNGATWDPIAGNLTATSYTWDFSQLPAGAQYRIKVIATDGINTGYDQSDAPFTIKAQIYLPLILRHG